MGEVIVVGGGAAGCIAAAAAAGRGYKVTLYEKNEKLGKKLFITGKGRCNVTNACDAQDYFDHVVSNAKFLYSALYGFDSRSVMAFFEQAGCRLKTERGGRVFPVTDHSSDVIKALQEELKKNGVRVVLNEEVAGILAEPQEMEGHGPNEAERRITGVVLKNGREHKAGAVIVATGGFSYQATGSTGDGYRFARELGLTVTEIKPALVPLELKEDYGRKLQGLALKNVSASLYFGKKEIYSGFGEMLFTHFGVSGPLILSASSYYAKYISGREREAVLRLDLKPALTEEQLDARILRDFEENNKKQFKNAIGGLFPIRLIPVMIEVSGIDPEKKVQDITRQERLQFVRRIKSWDMTVKGTRGCQEAIITQGGVSVKEMNPSTMESKKVRGLYFAGEVLDVDALTGGFNLQAAWSTGRLAGDSVEP